ncbi:hypothetical protein C1T06_23120 [Vibrio parahaemolyticus]|nr:hypothetical protein C1T06_23120 [Vibrio parahaemolyticus]
MARELAGMPVKRTQKEVVVKETTKERIERQRKERYRALEKSWESMEEDEARFAAHRKKVLDKRKLVSEVGKATEELLIFLPTLKLETSIHSQAVKEFSEAFDVILKGHDKDSITYEVGSDLIHQIKDGFIEGGTALSQLENNRQIRNAEKVDNYSQEDGYQRNLVVNDESFNVRFKASCATPECLMRNANIDMEDDAFQDYIEAATKDKRSDVMQVISTALIANPYLKVLERVALVDSGYSVFIEGKLDPLWSTALGKGTAYRLKLLNFSERVQHTAENAVSYISGDFLDSNKDK